MTTTKEPISCAGRHLTRAALEQLIKDNGGPEGLTLLDANLSGEDLSDLDLHGLNFGEWRDGKWVGAANLWRANLQGADLWGANLQRADLRHAKLQGTRLEEADLQGADLGGANLHGAFLVYADLQGADLRHANLQGANLVYANLQGANLEAAQLQGAVLWNARLQGADLRGAKLQGAHLALANLQGAMFERAQLQGTYLWRVVNIEASIGLDDADWGNYRLGNEDDELSRSEATYRRLKQWHTQRGLYDRAGEFFYREMECRRKGAWFGDMPPRWRELLWPPKAWGRLLRTLWPKNLPAFLGYTLMRATCGYGERPWRAIFTALAILFGLGALYFFLPGALAPAPGATAVTFGDALLFSGLSFTALGYPSWAPVPLGWVRFLGIVEGFLGWLTISLFLVTFTRKMTRG